MSQMETGNVHARHKEAMAGSGAIPPPIDTDVPSPAAPGNEREDNLQRKRMQRVPSDGTDALAVEKQGHELLAVGVALLGALERIAPRQSRSQRHTGSWQAEVVAGFQV